MHSRANSLICCLALLLLLLATAARAETVPPANDQILQQELRQQQIKTTVQRVSDQLGAVIGEFERNEISGEDVKVLKAIRGVLGHLTEQEMEQVLGFLRQARGAKTGPASRQDAAEAYSGQKTIITQLRQLLLEYERQQALYEVSLRLKELSVRQAANLRLGLGLDRIVAGKSLESFEEPQKLNLLVQQKDQESIRDETAMILARLEKMSKEISDGPNSERPKAAVRQAKESGLSASLQVAAAELKAGRLVSAAGHEKAARDGLREVARLLTFSLDPTEALRQALHALDQTIDQQKLLAAETRKLEAKEAAVEAENRQAELVDASDLIRQDVDSLAPAAADHLRNAMDKMQEARATLASDRQLRDKSQMAPLKQGEALAHLDQARRTLEDELAKAEQRAIKPDQGLVGLKELQEQVRELIKEEEKLGAETAVADKKDLPANAPRQGELRDAAQELQQKTASQVPAAAQSIGEAARQMQKAQSALASGHNNPSAQQAAIESLQRAEQQLGRELGKLDQAEKELSSLQELQQRLREVIERQQEVHLATAKEAMKPAPAPAPLRQVSDRQNKLGIETGQLQQQASTSAPGASSHLGKARDRMGEAKSELDKPEPKAAQPRQTEALADLYQAQKVIEKKIDERKESLGLKPHEKGKALADAASIIKQARKDVSQALSEMQQGPENFMESLTEQQREIAETLVQMSERSPASRSTELARRAAQVAAKQLTQNNLPAAVSAMGTTQSGLNGAVKAAEQGRSPDLGSASLPELVRKQAKVKEMTEALMGAQKSAPAGVMQKAAQLMEQAADAVGPLAAGKVGGLPESAQAALQSAQSALATGAAQASAGQGSPAQDQANVAAEALARAQAALSLAQAGLSSDSPAAGAGQSQGQGQTPGQGQSQKQGNGPGKGQGQEQAKGTPGSQGTGKGGNWDGDGGADGPRNGTEGKGQFTGLPKRDRAALKQSQAEKYPQEYGPLVEQYLKNLSDQSSGGKSGPPGKFGGAER